MKRSEKRSFLLFGLGAGFFVLVLAWWLVFFASQGDRLVERLEEAGVGLTSAQSTAVHAAARESLRMFAFEGGFLALLAIGGLLLVLRSMRHELEMHRRQRDFLSAITHELRSPIASARLQVETLQLGRVPAERAAHYYERTLDDLDRLGRTIDQLLTAARASSGRVQLELGPVDLNEFTQRTVARLADVDHSGARIEFSGEAPVRVLADTQALATIVENLLSNALKYGGEPAHVEVRVTRKGQGGVLHVRDHGPGLDDHDAGRVFEPFTRGHAEIVERRPGVGLGLYLVNELTRALGGRLHARDAQGGGLDVSVELPLAVESSAA